MNQLPLNKNELPLIREMLTKYKQGYISGLIPGSNITFSPSECRNKIISSTGGGGGSIEIQNITYLELKALYDAGTLTPLQWYRITDYATIYDQTLSDVTKTAAGEVLLVQATSASTLSNVAKSESFPDDIIHYDITKDTTFINAAAAKGKITYREDKAGNKAYFDWRKVLQYNPNDASEALIYDLSQPIVSVNEISTTPEIAGSLASLEFPSVQLKGSSYLNSNNVLAAAYFNGVFSQNANNFMASTSVGGDFSQNINLNVADCNITGNVISCQTGTWTESTFGENVNNIVSTNIWATDVAGRIEALIDCYLLPGTGITRNTFDGKLEWCSHFLVKGFNCVGDVVGIYQITVNNSTCNCKFQYINGTSNHAEKFGFDACTITGNSSSSTFANNRITTKLSGKIITETSYPELFHENIETTIYSKPNDEKWYRWLDDSNVWQFTQIV